MPTTQPPQHPRHSRPSRGERPPHLRWGPLGLVALGGALGTGLRALLAEAFPAQDGISWVILGINVVGAFCLGLLLESLARRGPDVGRHRTVRLFVGTGILGGFTTYSTLADDTARLLDVGRWAAGTGYALLSVVLGLAAAAAGILLAAALRRRSPEVDAAGGVR
ncbi:fluoride efflux transporter FluC [Curtobacterium sp. L1-20]|uniref:fluoride efflux transporter FluC n=1 Tax=Curtobacterium sp. L1-20 TaxID=3138181 RepID=UPI003B518627